MSCARNRAPSLSIPVCYVRSGARCSLKLPRRERYITHPCSHVERVILHAPGSGLRFISPVPFPVSFFAEAFNLISERNTVSGPLVAFSGELGFKEAIA